MELPLRLVAADLLREGRGSVSATSAGDVTNAHYDSLKGIMN